MLMNHTHKHTHIHIHTHIHTPIYDILKMPAIRHTKKTIQQHRINNTSLYSRPSATHSTYAHVSASSISTSTSTFNKQHNRYGNNTNSNIIPANKRFTPTTS